MSNNSISNIHDTFFRETLSHKEIASDFLQSYLPSHVRQYLDLDTLTICKETFVDARQAAHYSDLLYQVMLKGGAKGFVYVLFEHKSFPDDFTALQLLRYMLEIWELHRKQKPSDKKLPLVIPIVIYHGKPKGKAIPLKDLVHIPDEALSIYIPNFDMLFYDFSPKSDEDIKGQILLQVVLYCFKAAHHNQAEHMIKEIFQRMSQLDDNTYTMQWIERVWQYVSHVVDVTHETVVDIAQQNLSGKKEGTIMTLAQRLEQHGEARGIIMGRNEGRSEILTRLLSRKFGAPVLTSVLQQRLKIATTDQLDYWAERILDAQSITEVFADN